MVFNILISRFKNNLYQRFLTHKEYIKVYLTIFAIFEPQTHLKAIAHRTIEAIKRASA